MLKYIADMPAPLNRAFITSFEDFRFYDLQRTLIYGVRLSFVIAMTIAFVVMLVGQFVASFRCGENERLLFLCYNSAFSARRNLSLIAC